MTQLLDLDRILQRAQIGNKEMTETKTYELTHDEVLGICQALKFHADALDHLDGNPTESAAWAGQAASLWRLIDKFVRETPSIRLARSRGGWRKSPLGS
jgi:hypothetical protein